MPAVDPNTIYRYSMQQADDGRYYGVARNRATGEVACQTAPKKRRGDAYTLLLAWHNKQKGE